MNGVLPKRTEGADITAGKTIDQYAADKLGADTPLRSLELTTESSYMVGNCENGYSCAYLNSTSWRTPNTPLPHERNPRVVFQRLFGDGGSVTARLEQMRKDRSILDSIAQSFTRLERRIGVSDRRTIGDIHADNAFSAPGILACVQRQCRDMPAERNASRDGVSTDEATASDD